MTGVVVVGDLCPLFSVVILVKGCLSRWLGEVVV